MSEQPPYNAFDESFSELPLPDENLAWQNMEVLLDKDSPRRAMPPVWLKSCAGWVAVLLLVAGGVYFGLHIENTRRSSVDRPGAPSRQEALPPASFPRENTFPGDAPTATPVPQPGEASTPAPKNKGNAVPGPNTSAQDAGSPGITSVSAAPNDVATAGTASTTSTAGSSTIAKPSGSPVAKAAKASPKRGQASIAVSSASVRVRSTKAPTGLLQQPGPGTGKTTQPGTEVPAASVKQNEKTESKPGDSNMPPASAQRVGPEGSADKLVARDPVEPVPPVTPPAAATPSAEPKKNRNRFWLSAGIGVQQGIPIAGQSSVSQTYYGNTSLVTDYIPLAYLRLHYGNWFLQGEFQYGAPQAVRELPYSQKTQYDTANHLLVTTSSRLMKTYYHHIPLSLNYQLARSWSVGVGGIYSIFHGAVNEQVVRSRDVLNPGSETVKTSLQNLKQFNDSFLYKTQLQLFLQTEYQWKRFSLGLRYAADLEPFIRYTRPDGTVDAQKGQALQVILRYRLWQSK